MKTLDDAIGCWTTRPDWNSVVPYSKLISNSAKACRRETLRNNPMKLVAELEILRNRLNGMLELTTDAERRLAQIIATNELEK
jgi:hypothetical protein